MVWRWWISCCPTSSHAWWAWSRWTWWWETTDRVIGISCPGSSAAKITLDFKALSDIVMSSNNSFSSLPRLQADQLFHTLKDHGANEDDHWRGLHIYVTTSFHLSQAAAIRSVSLECFWGGQSREDRALYAAIFATSPWLYDPCTVRWTKPESSCHCRYRHWLFTVILIVSHPNGLNLFPNSAKSQMTHRLSGITESDCRTPFIGVATWRYYSPRYQSV